MLINKLSDFIIARDQLRLFKESGVPKPWTEDPILQQYRFCNVRREDDKVTKWIAQYWRDNEQDNWFAMAVARWINWPDTLVEIGYPLPWNPVKVLERMMARRARGDKVWTGAYMIGTQGAATDKPKYIVFEILDKLWEHRVELRPRKSETIMSFAERLVAMRGQGKFMVGQIIADAKYCDPDLAVAEDWATFALSGPGSRRGLNRVVGQDKDCPWDENVWHQALLGLRKTVCPPLRKKLGYSIHAQDLQNCLCEFDKYERVRLGEGEPRSSYPGVA